MRRKLLQGWYVNRGFRNIIYIQEDAKWWLEYHMFVAMGQCVDPQKASCPNIEFLSHSLMVASVYTNRIEPQCSIRRIIEVRLRNYTENRLAKWGSGFFA